MTWSILCGFWLNWSGMWFGYWDFSYNSPSDLLCNQGRETPLPEPRQHTCEKLKNGGAGSDTSTAVDQELQALFSRETPSKQHTHQAVVWEL